MADKFRILLATIIFNVYVYNKLNWVAVQMSGNGLYRIRLRYKDRLTVRCGMVAVRSSGALQSSVNGSIRNGCGMEFCLGWVRSSV